MLWGLQSQIFPGPKPHSAYPKGVRQVCCLKKVKVTDVSEPQQHPANHRVSRDSEIPSLSPWSESDHHNLCCCHHNTLSACQGWTPMLQIFTLGEQDLGHL